MAVDPLEAGMIDRSIMPSHRPGRRLDALARTRFLYCPESSVFGQPTPLTCAFVDSGTCKGSRERDFGQLPLLADMVTRDVISRTRGRRKLSRSRLMDNVVGFRLKT